MTTKEILEAVANVDKKLHTLSVRGDDVMALAMARQELTQVYKGLSENLKEGVTNGG